MVGNESDGASTPFNSVVTDGHDRAQKTEAEAEASRAEALRSVVARLQRRFHELYVEINYKATTHDLPATIYRRVNQLKDDADILLMLVDGTDGSDGVDD